MEKESIDKNLNKLITSNKKIEELTENYPLDFKTSHLGHSTSNYANQLERDILKHRRRDRTFKQGTLVFVDFGMNFGSEFSGPHYAITLSKYDNKYTRTVTVLPLTSKSGKHNVELTLNINQLLIDYFQKDIRPKYLNDLEIKPLLFVTKSLYEAYNNSQAVIYKDEKPIEQEYVNSIKELNRINDTDYQQIFGTIEQRVSELNNSLNKKTFARIDSITTIDKNKIFKSKGILDPMGKIIIPAEQMLLINKIILEYLTF